MSKEINIQDYLHYYLGQEMVYIGNGKPFKGTKIREVLTIENLELLNFSTQRKLTLRPLSDMTEEETQELWIVIGGTPHLYSFGKDDLIKGLDDGDWEESGIQMDYYTMSCVINYLRKIGIDCDDLIDSGLAIDKTQM